jgi:hypothetical protein
MSFGGPFFVRPDHSQPIGTDELNYPLSSYLLLATPQSQVAGT